ncbi:MAG TPA: ABC transporter permease [Chloroflexota bacterium]|nr:ABC transporter permease [Chloroflexota bacterium]
MTFVIRRFLVTIPVLVLVTVMTFSLIHLIPGDPATVILGQEATPGAKAALRHQLGLDRPAPIQYVSWVWGVAHGDLGNSLTDRTPVSTEIIQRLPVTVELAIGAFLVAIFLAIPLGILSALNRGRFLDYIAMLFAFGGMSIPPFWLAIMFILFFAVRLHWFPASGYVPLLQNPRANLAAMAMPMVATGIREAAVLMRLLRSSLLETLSQDYIRTARSKGIRRWAVILKHAVRNALIPVVTASGLTIAGLLGGIVITETVFSLPGFGRLIVEAVYQRDFVTVQGAVLVSALFVIAVNLVVDVSYAFLDPRIKL